MRALVALVLLVSAVAHAVPEEALLRRKVVTSDGAALALYRYVPNGGGGSRPAVLLVPDVGFAREVYDFEGRGLARELQAHGRDVFVIELRGQGRSTSPASWSLKDWVERDLPAAVAAVQRAHPGQLDLMVQGFGGSLVLASTTRELSGLVGRVIALSPPVAAEVPNETVRALLKGGGKFSELKKPEFELLYTHAAKLPNGVASEFRSRGLYDLSPVAAAELLGWMESGDLVLRDGSKFSDRIAKVDRPCLWLLPLRDNFAHPEFGSQIRDVAPKAKVTPLGLNRVDLMAEDYTHLSTLLGSSAPVDVFARIEAWLRASDPAMPMTAEDSP